MGSPRWSRFAGRTCDPAGDPRWSSLLLKDCTPCKGPMLEQFMKNCSPWEGLTLEKFVEDCLLWEKPHTGAEEEHEQEGVAETTCDELTATPIPRPPAPLGEKEVENSGVKLSLGRREGWGEGVFKIWFYFSLSYSDLTGNKLN